jgi:hypothetical protein
MLIFTDKNPVRVIFFTLNNLPKHLLVGRFFPVRVQMKIKFLNLLIIYFLDLGQGKD